MNKITILAGPEQGWEGIDHPEKYAVHLAFRDRFYMFSFFINGWDFFAGEKINPCDKGMTMKEFVKFYSKLFDKFLHSKRMEWQEINEDGDPITAIESFMK